MWDWWSLLWDIYFSSNFLLEKRSGNSCMSSRKGEGLVLFQIRILRIWIWKTDQICKYCAYSFKHSRLCVNTTDYGFGRLIKYASIGASELSLDCRHKRERGVKKTQLLKHWMVLM